MAEKLVTPTGQEGSRASRETELEPTPGLRQRALERARGLSLATADDSSLSVEDARDLLHELRVHQIELELQNGELRASQEQLELTRARYFDLYDLAPVGYLTIAEDGIVLEANLTAASLLDAPRSAIVKRAWTRFVLPADQDVLFKHRRELFTSGLPRTCELRLMKASGEPFWVRIESRIAGGEGGSRVCRTILSDITEHKRWEEALQASEARHRTLFQNSPDALLTLTPPDWSVSSCNAASVAMFGARDEHDLLSRSFAQCSHERQPDNRLSLERANALLTAALREGSGAFDWTFARSEAEDFAASVTVTRMEAAGVPFLQATVRDQTQERRRRADSAQTERLASMGLLAASMGHEINNPLAYLLANVEDLAQILPKFAAVSGRCSAGLRALVGEAAFSSIVGKDAQLLEPAELEGASERARDALDGARRVTCISRALGTFGRIDSSDLCKVDLQQALESALAMTANEIRFRNTLTLDFKPVPLVWASEGKLSQVFLNLLINASHAMADSETRVITVRTWTDETSACVGIEDTGSGIKPENMTRIFEPFFSTKPVGGGSGLGLSICHNIIKEFGGDIQVESELNKGTRFVVRLPIWTEAAALRSAPPAAEAVLANVLGRILIIDDEAPLRLVMQRLLRAHETVSVSSGKEALAILQHDRAFDLILCDLMMPEVSGMDVHHWLVTHDPALAARLVFITGGAFGPVAAEYLSDAGNLKLQKPFTSADLKEMVSDRIRASKSEPPTRRDIPVTKPGSST